MRCKFDNVTDKQGFSLLFVKLHNYSFVACQSTMGMQVVSVSNCMPKDIKYIYT